MPLTIDTKRYRTLLLYSGIFITGLLTANILGSKIVTIFGLSMPSATFAYAVTYLMTDVVGELYGKEEADRLVRVGFICLIVSILFIRVSILLPSDNDTTSFNVVFNSTSRIILASLAGYIVSQSIDVFLFHKIRFLSVKYKFIRNNISTIVSQFLDTAIFSFIGFYGVVPNVWQLIWGVYVAKVIIALCDTPFFYLLTRNQKEIRFEQSEK